MLGAQVKYMQHVMLFSVLCGNFYQKYSQTLIENKSAHFVSLLIDHKYYKQ